MSDKVISVKPGQLYYAWENLCGDDFVHEQEHRGKRSRRLGYDEYLTLEAALQARQEYLAATVARLSAKTIDLVRHDGTEETLALRE